MVSEQVAASTSGSMVAGESSIRLNRNTITWMTFNIYTLTPTPSKNPKDMSVRNKRLIVSFQIIPMACEVKEGVAKSWLKALRASESLKLPYLYTYAYKFRTSIQSLKKRGHLYLIVIIARERLDTFGSFTFIYPLTAH